MYSALTEDRVYRKACTKEEAFEKIQERVNAGFVSQEVLDALKKGLN